MPYRLMMTCRLALLLAHCVHQQPLDEHCVGSRIDCSVKLEVWLSPHEPSCIPQHSMPTATRAPTATAAPIMPTGTAAAAVPAFCKLSSLTFGLAGLFVASGSVLTEVVVVASATVLTALVPAITWTVACVVTGVELVVVKGTLPVATSMSVCVVVGSGVVRVV